MFVERADADDRVVSDIFTSPVPVFARVVCEVVYLMVLFSLCDNHMSVIRCVAYFRNHDSIKAHARFVGKDPAGIVGGEEHRVLSRAVREKVRNAAKAMSVSDDEEGGQV